MTELDRLHELIETLPARQVHALLAILEPSQPISDEEFARRLGEAPEEDVDEETSARILAAQSDPGDTISHEELKRRLGL